MQSPILAEQEAAPSRRRVLFLTPQLPYPPHQGTAIRNLNLILRVAQEHNVSLLSFTEEGASDPGPLARYCERVATVPVPTRSRWARLVNLMTSGKPDMAQRLASDAFKDRLREWVLDQEYDVIQVEGIEMAPYGMLVRQWLGAGGPKIVFDDHNAEFLLQRRAWEIDMRRPRRWPAAAYSFVQWLRLRRYEASVCRDADAVVAVSEADADALQRLVPDVCSAVIPNGVDSATYQDGKAKPAELRHPAVLFTAKMDFRPNVDAMLWFHQQVWPLVLAEIPTAHLYVVGKNPHVRLEPLLHDESVDVTGFVPEIAPYLLGCDVYIVPLRIGGGTRLKVLEAMAAGLAMVSTRLGAEGIPVQDEKELLLCDGPGAFADGVVRILGEPNLRQRLGESARTFVRAHYEWDAIVPDLLALYNRL